MFMVSFRLSRRRILLAAAAVVAVVGLGVCGVRMFGGGEAMTSATSKGEPSEKIKAQKMKKAEDQLAFIRSYGWEVEPEPAEVLEVIIPEAFDAVYQEYNVIQKQQGLNLEKYAGKRCKRYAYTITNYPGEEGEVRIHLLLYNGKLVGGDVCSTRPDGFMHGFSPQV